MTSDRINVLHLVDSGWPGGINSFVLELLRSIDRSRFKIGICSFSSNGPLLEEMSRLGADVYTSRTTWDYFRRIRAGEYQILHANFGGRVHRCTARMAGCRVVVHAHGVPEACVDRVRQGDPSLEREFKTAFGACADAIVACSRSVSEALSKVCPSLEHRLSVIYNGTDLTRQRPVFPEEMRIRKLKARLPGNAIVVGFAGRLIRLKRVDCLLTAAERLVAKHPNLYFLILGEGPLRSELEKQASPLGDRVRFLGWSRGSDWFPLFDILALPSESEGMPFSVLEAMAGVTPVVASAVGGLPEVVINGETGILIPPGDSQSLETALDTLIRSPETRHRIGLAARARAELAFDSRAMARRLEELYTKLIPGR
jgi:glycosyltransferase involved in cell wall biosynthesis